MTNRLTVLTVHTGLDLETRRQLITIAQDAIDSADAHIVLNCAQIDALDESTLGMLVVVARNAQRRGTRVELDHASARMRKDLDNAGVSYLFAW